MFQVTELLSSVLLKSCVVPKNLSATTKGSIGASAQHEMTEIKIETIEDGEIVENSPIPQRTIVVSENESVNLEDANLYATAPALMALAQDYAQTKCLSQKYILKLLMTIDKCKRQAIRHRMLYKRMLSSNNNFS